MKYRIMLQAEDGTSCLRDGYDTLTEAEFVADKLSEQCGEGQMLYIESYKPYYAAFV
jgi:hypothetical protein